MQVSGTDQRMSCTSSQQFSMAATMLREMATNSEGRVRVKYVPTDIGGVTIVDIEPDRDDRGFVSHLFCASEFTEYGLISSVARMDVAYNYARGTLRGIHRQVPPNVEAKLVRCTRGAIAAVAVDVRPESSNYGDHVMVQLSADNRRALFLPPFIAHGFQTLADNTEVLYQVSGVYDAEAEQGFRWDDPKFGIEWPLAVSVISAKDASWPLLASVGRAAS
jgi:dTDP-4-dehydrorhamnose 3,5-epimerase